MGLGPLTNLALAMRLDPAFTSHLAGLYIMGGNTSGTVFTVEHRFPLHHDWVTFLEKQSWSEIILLRI